MTKYLFVTGGIVSSLGKGVASAAIGALLKDAGYNISFVKADPYINVDPGTMNPFQHGEVYITADGSETDLDLGHYERFTEQEMSKVNNFTAGKVYDTVLKKERKGDFLGKTVQVIPHITGEIQNNIYKAGRDKDILIVEIGGTVGDIESLPFLEAIRQMRFQLPEEDILYIHMTLIPWIDSARELKTKPTQHSVNKLREIGIQPDVLICRSSHSFPKQLKEKIALFTNVKKENVIAGINASCIYEIPLLFQEEGIFPPIKKRLNLKVAEPKMTGWRELVKKYKSKKQKVSVAMVGKYMELQDAYKSLLEALEHAAVNQNLELDIVQCEPESLEESSNITLDCDAILVPGAFGKRGSEGKISIIKYARENKIPFLGICYGFQMAIIEYARGVLGMKDVSSTEIKPAASNPIVDLMEAQKKELNLGGSMRLGSSKVSFKKNSKIAKIYDNSFALERHRHRFELNNEYIEKLEQNGMQISGYFEGKLAESLEIKDHPWFIAVQYHPEFRSSPFTPHPLFLDYIKQAHSLGKKR
jgi:CTP synthase